MNSNSHRLSPLYYKRTDSPSVLIILNSNNYVKYKSNGDINKTLSVEEYLNKITTYLKGIINNFKKSDTWKI